MNEAKSREMLRAIQALARQIDRRAARGHSHVIKGESIAADVEQIGHFTDQLREIVSDAQKQEDI